MREPLKRCLKLIGLVLVCAAWAGVFVHTWRGVGKSQWDFAAYYVAGQAFDRGLNPYSKTDLVSVSGPGTHPLPFIYPLSVLYVLKPITSLYFPTAHHAWLLIKLGVLIGLMLVWKRGFLQTTDWLWLLVVALLAFQAAAVWDIQAGNVSSIEQLFLWSGFLFLMRRKLVAFTVLVTAAAFFKITLLAFLFLLFLPGIRSRASIPLFLSSVLVAIAIVWFSFAGHRELFADFVRAARVTPALLKANPSAFALATDLSRRYPATIGVSALVPYLLWLLFTAAMLFSGRRLIAGAWRSRSIVLAIMIACFGYALVVPRFMIYSHMILIVPVLALVLPAARRLPVAAVAIAIVVCIDGLQVLPGDAGKLLDDIEPLLVLCVCWFLLVYAEAKGIVKKELLTPRTETA